MIDVSIIADIFCFFNVYRENHSLFGVHEIKNEHEKHKQM